MAQYELAICLYETGDLNTLPSISKSWRKTGPIGATPAILWPPFMPVVDGLRKQPKTCW